MNPEEQLERRRAANRKWRQAHLEKARAANRRWRNANREKSRAKLRKWRKANLEKAREAVRTWRKANPQKAREAALAWRKANPETNRKASLAWQKANPEKAAAISQARRARRLAATGSFTAEQAALRAATLGEVCFYCAGPWEHDDHFFALSTHLDNSAENIVPACGACNTSKGDSHPTAWLAKRSKLTPLATLALDLLTGKRSAAAVKRKGTAAELLVAEMCLRGSK